MIYLILLLKQMIKDNGVHIDEIVSVFLSMTKDLNATFPAKAARNIGLTHTPLLCLNELDVPGSVQGCIRILMHVNTLKKQIEMHHIYLREAVHLRPEFSKDIPDQPS